MDRMKLQKEKLKDFLDVLSKQKLFAPVKEGETYSFAPVTADTEISLEYTNTTKPPKDVLFPQTESLFYYQYGDVNIDSKPEAEDRVVLGIRPCDAKAFNIVDNLFSWDEDDTLYLEKREKATLVGLSCLEPCVNCFCTSLNGGPASTEGLDVLMTDLGESFLLQPVTEKGDKLIQEAGDCLDNAEENDNKKAEELQQAAEQKISRKVEVEDIPEKLKELWESEIWQDISDACLGCGICTYLCPTCHCFDIQDEVEGFDGRRCRMWDSCMFEEYTLHASGHNPRSTRRERTRNRINHKYNYFVNRFGSIACVGCGRCTSYCPVNIDILNILNQVKEAL